MIRLFALFIVGILLTACAVSKETLDNGQLVFDASNPKAHHTNGRFQNIGKFKPSEGGSWFKLAFDPYRLRQDIPENHVLPYSAALKQFRSSTKQASSVTWIGHSTFLIRVDDAWILTDPVFSKYATFIPPFGPKRLVAPGLKIEDLPPIDVIIISHNHYDHTDVRSLKKLAKISPNTRVIIPLQNGRTVNRAKFNNVTEVDWFETVKTDGLSFTAVPAVHSSKRWIADDNKALWAGWSINTGRQKIYYAGDTGAGSFIHEIRKRLGVHRTAFIPIGAYSPVELEEGHHVTPEQSVAIARTLGASHAIPMHWGTFAQSPEPIAEQRSRFLAASSKGLSPHLMKIGQTISLP